ncbi:hypothetical protein [Mycolicibacterium baixiangningiae]|uniref:hypothetical protein n=1 Tax=Mycolicibacterium baixiangningiae TaxID=2761578 RepID=UPI0018691820|nr:hypothetical protein [Mycolicibacterium baixiangningiae]
MALIRSLEPDKQVARPPRTEVDCLYTTVNTDDGQRLLRLATLGSDQRKLHPKPSQIIELDETMAAKLVAVLQEAFPRIANRDGT